MSVFTCRKLAEKLKPVKPHWLSLAIRLKIKATVSLEVIDSGRVDVSVMAVTKQSIITSLSTSGRLSVRIGAGMRLKFWVAVRGVVR